MYTGNEAAEETTPKKKNNSVAVGILSLIIIGSFGWLFWGGGFQWQVASSMQSNYEQVVSDNLQQYQIASDSGNKQDMCLYAGIVAGSYLQAKDEANYQQWKQTEQTNCAAVGVPDMGK